MSHFLRLLIESVASINSNFQSQGGTISVPGWEQVSPRLGLFAAQLGSKFSIASLRLVRNEITAFPLRSATSYHPIRATYLDTYSSCSMSLCFTAPRFMSLPIHRCATMLIFQISENSGTLNRTCASFLYFVCHILAQSEKPVETGY